jgi:hypothetical protein
MSKQFGLLVVPSLLFAGMSIAGPVLATAQDGTTPPPKVLIIQNEQTKPGQNGAPHQKTEGAFVRAFAAAKWPQHYFGMESMSGKARSLFFVSYDSYEAWQKDNDAVAKNATLSAALTAANVADGALVEAFEQSAYNYREDQSLNAPVKIEDMRYMELTIFKVKPGHQKDWSDLVKLYQKAYEGKQGVHWATFEKMYGTESGSRFLVATPMKSLAEVDQEILSDKSLMGSMSADDLKKLGELNAACLESVESSIFAISPKMSYVSDAWVKSDPAFWGQK